MQNYVSTKSGSRSGNSAKGKFPDFPLLGFSEWPTGPPPVVRDHNLYIRLNKKQEKGSLFRCCILLLPTQ